MSEYYRQSEIEHAEALQARRKLEEACRSLEALTAEKRASAAAKQQQQQQKAANRIDAEGAQGLGRSSSSQTLSEMVNKLDEIRATLAATRIAPMNNPYSKAAEEEAAANWDRLRPHTLALLAPQSFEGGMEPVKLDCVLLDAHTTLQSEKEKAAAREAEREASHQQQQAEYRNSIKEWRFRENDQLSFVHRRGVERAYAEKEYWTVQNQRNKHIMDKVSEITRKAKEEEAARLHARESLALLAAQSAHRVAMDCLADQEMCVRKAIESAERSVFDEVVCMPHKLMVSSNQFAARRAPQGSPLKASPGKLRQC
jgi:hypothetical protein